MNEHHSPKGLSRSQVEADIARAIIGISRLWRVEASSSIVDYNLPDPAGWVLLEISRATSGTHAERLIQDLTMSRQMIGRILVHLECIGFIRRDRVANDHRQKAIHITALGAEQALTLERRLGVVRQSIFADRSDVELQSLRQVLSNYMPQPSSSGRQDQRQDLKQKTSHRITSGDLR